MENRKNQKKRKTSRKNTESIEPCVNGPRPISLRLRAEPAKARPRAEHRICPYLNPYPKTSIIRIGISYSSASVPFEQCSFHIHTDADHRRRRPSVRSPLPPDKRAITAAAVQPCHHRRKTVRRGHHKTVLWVSGGTIKTVRCGHRKTVLWVCSGTIKTVRRAPQDSLARPPPPQDNLFGCPARLSRLSGGLCETVWHDRRRMQRRTIQSCRARRRQPSQHKPARHGRGCASWPANTACHPSRSPATARKSHRR
jgi:hypothetical protein